MPIWTATQPDRRVIPTKDVVAETLGRDIAFERGDLVVAASGDWATVEGEQAVRASLQRRATSGEGSFVFRPTYGAGLVAQVHKPLDRGTIEQIGNRLRDQTKADRRVRQAEVIVERRALDVARILLRARLRQIPQTIAPLEFTV